MLTTQIVDTETAELLRELVASDREFAFVVYPDGTPKFIDLDSELFDVSFFDGETPERPMKQQPPTVEADYLQRVGGLIERLAETGGKTVISRVISVEGQANPADVALSYFAKLPTTFRAIFRTAATGLWILATPELILEQTATGELTTMSLAGTRRAGAEGEWDAKNRREHQFVTRHIVDTLSAAGLSVEVGSPENVRFGNVEHLCEKISARGDADFFELLKKLSPTPAICGYPRREALSDIRRIEPHRRYCYGGYIAVEHDGRLLAFLTLRCAMVTPIANNSYVYTIYSGGGITGDSSAADEWRETEAKASALINSIEINDKP